MELLAMLILSIAMWLPGAGAPEQREVPPLPPPFCGELDAADCQLLADSQELMAGVESMTMALQVDAAMRGIPELADEDLMFGMSMDMSVHLDPAFNEQMRALAMSGPEELLAAQDELAQMVVDFYDTLAMDMDMEMMLPGALLQVLEAEEDVVLPETMIYQTRMVDGYVYVNLDVLAESIPELGAEMASEGIEGWIGFDFVGQLEQQMSGAAPVPNTSTLESMQMGMAFNQMMADETIRALLDPYVTVERLADEERDGMPVAVFRTSVDLGSMVSNPDFTRMLREAADSMIAASGETVDQQELGAGLLGVQMLANILARSFEFEIVQAVGIEQPYVYDYGMMMEMDLSGLLTLAAMIGEDLPPELLRAKPVFSFDMDASYADYDSAPAVEAPEGAQIIPLDSMDQESMNVVS